MTRQSVVVVGATGQTGSSIVNGLLECGNFTVIAAVRPSSISKPEVIAPKSRGVEVRVLDLETWTVDQLAEQLTGIDTVISAIFASYLELQRPLVDAAKKAGVKRFIPDDWATACVRRVRKFHDANCDSETRHDYIKEVGVGYTFIDVGVWTQVILTFADPSRVVHPLLPKKILKNVYGTGNVKTAIADLRDIGKFVARIIADERTLNRYVFCWTEETTQNEAVTLAERISGQKFETVKINSDGLLEMIKQAEDPIEETLLEYAYSQWIRGDNLIENAKSPEYGEALDVRELYPELGKELRTLEDYSKEFFLS